MSPAPYWRHWQSLPFQSVDALFQYHQTYPHRSTPLSHFISTVFTVAPFLSNKSTTLTSPRAHASISGVSPSALQHQTLSPIRSNSSTTSKGCVVHALQQGVSPSLEAASHQRLSRSIHQYIRLIPPWHDRLPSAGWRKLITLIYINTFFNKHFNSI